MIILSGLHSLDRVVIESYSFSTPSVFFSTPAPWSSITTSSVVSTLGIYIIYPSPVCLIRPRLVVIVVLIVGPVVTTSVLVISPVVGIIWIVTVVEVILVIIPQIIMVIIIIIIIIIKPSIIIRVCLLYTSRCV